MPFPWMAAATMGAAGLGFLGASGANRANVASAREASAANLSSAREQMAFQERMSNTALQRARDDMIKAKLNPMLMYSQGGASSPSGASASAVAPRVEDQLSGASNTALSYARNKAEVDILRSQASVAAKQDKFYQEMAQYDVALKNAQTANLHASSLLANNSAYESHRRSKALEVMFPQIKAQSKFESGLGGDVGRWLGLADRGVSTALDVKDLLNPVKPVRNLFSSHK